MTETPFHLMKELCVVTAVDVEFNTATSLLTSKTFTNEFRIKTCRGHVGVPSEHRRVTVLQCGMGALAFSEKLSEHLRHNRYDSLLIAGLAGGLDPRLKSGDAVIYDRCYDARKKSAPRPQEKPPACDEIASIGCDDQFSATLFDSLRSAGRRCFRGSGLNVSHIIIEGQEKLSLGQYYQAAAADMESYEVLAVCANFRLPAAALRIISDDADSNLPDFNWAARENGSLNPWRVAVAMASRPAASLNFLLAIRPVLAALRGALKTTLHT